MSITSHKVIVVCGPIAVGKTTFVKKCLSPYLSNQGKRVTIVPEPSDDWEENGSLVEFYADPKRKAYQFQTMAFHDRIVKTREAYEKSGTETDIFVLERSIFDDVIFAEMLHDENNMDDTEFRDYMKLWTMWSELMPIVPDLFVYLCPSIGESMRRKQHRDRLGEKEGVTLEYQKLLYDKHEKYLGSGFRNVSGNMVPVMRFSTDENFITDEKVRDEMCKDINLRIESLHHPLIVCE